VRDMSLANAEATCDPSVVYLNPFATELINLDYSRLFTITLIY